jgi:hypothetical protein
MPVNLALKKLRQEDYNFEASLGYKVRPSLKKQTEDSFGDYWLQKSKKYFEKL